MRAKRWRGELFCVSALAVLGAVAVPSASRAVTGACVPPVSGAPWFGTTPTVSDISQLGGLQWTGSFGWNWNQGATTSGDFRFVTVQDTSQAGIQGYLYFYWRSSVVEPSVTNDEGVTFGFTVPNNDSANPGAIGQAITIQMQGNELNHPKLAQPVASPPSAVQVAQKFGLNDPVAIGSPAWLSNPAYVNTWLIPADDKTNPNDTAKFTWAITAKIPIKGPPTSNNGNYLTPITPSGGGLLVETDVPGVFVDGGVVTSAAQMNVWTDMFWGNPSGQMPIVHYPDSLATDDYPTDPSLPQVPKVTSWNTAQLIAPTSASCSVPGMYITSDDIAVVGGSWAGDLHAYTGTGATALPANNRVQVLVHNKGAQIDSATAAKIGATFSIAPYGSQTVQSNLWQALNDAGNNVQLDCSVQPCQPRLVGGKALVGVANGSSLSGTSDQTFAVNLTNPTNSNYWTPAWSYICATFLDADPTQGLPAQWGWQRFPAANQCGSGITWRPDMSLQPPDAGLGAHQCMLATLSSTDNRQFNQQSAFRNMHLGHASHFQEGSVIDSSGIQKIKGKNGHYLYLWVETRNMPKTQPWSPPIDDYVSKRSQDHLVVEKNGMIFDAKEGERISYDQAAEFMPTMVVHVYHEVGKKRRALSRKIYDVLEEQSNYGVFIQHDGELHGWRHMINGAERLRADYYRLFVPNDQWLPVTNVVETQDTACDATAASAVHNRLKELANRLRAKGSSYADDVMALYNQSKVQCIDLTDLINELRTQDDCDGSIGKLLDRIVKDSGCSC